MPSSRLTASARWRIAGAFLAAAAIGLGLSLLADSPRWATLLVGAGLLGLAALLARLGDR